VDSGQQRDALAKKYTARLVAWYKAGKLSADHLREGLERIPARVYRGVKHG
jgi:hypothetical protein